MDKSHADHSSLTDNRELSLDEQAWLTISKQRLDDILSNKVKTIPAEVVLKELTNF